MKWRGYRGRLFRVAPVAPPPPASWKACESSPLHSSHGQMISPTAHLVLNVRPHRLGTLRVPRRWLCSDRRISKQGS